MTTGNRETHTRPPEIRWDPTDVRAWNEIMKHRARARWFAFGIFAPYLLTVTLGLMFGYATAWGHQRGDSENVGLLAFFTLCMMCVSFYHTFSTLIGFTRAWWGERKEWKRRVAIFKEYRRFDPLSEDPPVELKAKYPAD